MLVYFDESYASKDRLMLGALFLPSKRGRVWLHRKFLKAKNDLKYLTKSGEPKEIKYNIITTSAHLEIAKRAVDLFFSSDDVYFRACVIPYDEKQLDKVGRQLGIPRKLKEAMLYTHATVTLLRNSIPEVRNAALVMDEITRAKGDRFNELIQAKLGNGEKAIFSHIGYTDSKSLRTHTIQICDLLLGSILNEHYPTKEDCKNQFREYVKQKLSLPELTKKYWGEKSQKWAEENHPKFTIRFWGVPYQYLTL